MARNVNRPLSPHLSVYRWGPHMLVSILHRATGSALAVGGGVMLISWLVAAASGKEAYDGFIDLMTRDGTGGLNPIPLIILVGLTWSFFQHLFSGLRHFVLDTGAGYELHTNRIWATMTVAGSMIVTLAIWAWLILGR